MAIKELEQYKALEQRVKNLFGDNTDLFSVVEELKELKNQPKTDCFDCTRRKWYMKGYQDGLNAYKKEGAE